MLEGTSLIVVYVVLCICGVLLHFLKKMKTVKEETGKFITIQEYYRDNPYTTAIALVSCVVVFLILFASGQMNLAVSFGVGYLCDSAADGLARRSLQKVE